MIVERRRSPEAGRATCRPICCASLAKPGAKVAEWFGQSPTMVPETVAVATHDSAYTGDKLRRELGWNPRSLDAGMQEMVDAIKAADAAKRADKRAERSRARAGR